MREVKPFRFAGGDAGCLLLHGFGGTPEEMLKLGEYLAGRGLYIIGARLAGHGTDPSELKRKTYRDWIESSLKSLQELKNNCKEVYVAGFSAGGTIALHLAATSVVDGVITICSPVYLDLRLYLARPVRYMFNFKREVERNIKDPAARQRHISYKTVPLKAVLELLALMRLVRSELDQITVQALLFQAREDQVVPQGNATFIYNRLTGAPSKKILWLENSGHMATIDYDKEVVYTEIYKFISDVSKT